MSKAKIDTAELRRVDARIKDMTVPRLQQLADGLGVKLGAFMNKIAELEKANHG